MTDVYGVLDMIPSGQNINCQSPRRSRRPQEPWKLNARAARTPWSEARGQGYLFENVPPHGTTPKDIERLASW